MEFRQHLHFVAALDLLYVVEITRVEELRSIDRECQFSLRADYFFCALWYLTFPAGPGDEVGATIVAGSAAPDVIKVERIEVDQLNAEITLFFNQRDGDDERFGAKIHSKHGVWRVRVGGFHSLVLRCVDPGDIADLIPGRFEFRTLPIHKVGIENQIVSHQWKTVDIGFLCNRSGFRGTDIFFCYRYTFFHLIFTNHALLVLIRS